MPPDITPTGRHPAGVVPTGHYLPDDLVWIYHEGTWCPGVVLTATEHAATITFRFVDVRGTCTDTVTAAYVLARFEPDPLVDPKTPVRSRPARLRSWVPSNYPFWRHAAP